MDPVTIMLLGGLMSGVSAYLIGSSQENAAKEREQEQMSLQRELQGRSMSQNSLAYLSNQRDKYRKLGINRDFNQSLYNTLNSYQTVQNA